MEGLSVSLHDLKMCCMRILCYFCSMPSHLYRSQQQLIDTDSITATAAGHLGKVEREGEYNERIVVVKEKERESNVKKIV